MTVSLAFLLVTAQRAEKYITWCKNINHKNSEINIHSIIYEFKII